jgi:hypothetical protein
MVSFLGWVVLFLDLGLISPLSVRFVGNDFTQSYPLYAQPNLTALMNILNYKLPSTNELLTTRIELLATTHTINTLSLPNTIDQHFPVLGSNCALKASTFIL